MSVLPERDGGRKCTNRPRQWRTRTKPRKQEMLRTASTRMCLLGNLLSAAEASVVADMVRLSTEGSSSIYRVPAYSLLHLISFGYVRFTKHVCPDFFKYFIVHSTPHVHHRTLEHQKPTTYLSWFSVLVYSQQFINAKGRRKSFL